MFLIILYLILIYDTILRVIKVYVYFVKTFSKSLLMDYKNLNAFLNTLEIVDNKDNILNEKNNTNLTQLERDINLNNKPNINLEMANPQRQYLNINSVSNKEDLNDKINNYNFIQKKIYKPNVTN